MLPDRKVFRARSMYALCCSQLLSIRIVKSLEGSDQVETVCDGCFVYYYHTYLMLSPIFLFFILPQQFRFQLGLQRSLVVLVLVVFFFSNGTRTPTWILSASERR